MSWTTKSERGGVCATSQNADGTANCRCVCHGDVSFSSRIGESIHSRGISTADVSIPSVGMYCKCQLRQSTRRRAATQGGTLRGGPDGQPCRDAPLGEGCAHASVAIVPCLTTGRAPDSR